MEVSWTDRMLVCRVDTRGVGVVVNALERPCPANDHQYYNYHTGPSSYLSMRNHNLQTFFSFYLLTYLGRYATYTTNIPRPLAMAAR